MSIRISWINNNITFTDIKIYRSTTKLEDSVLPTPLATLTTGTTYLDTTSLPDTVYWYAVSITNAGESVVSYLTPTVQNSVLGPGPTELLRGDAMCGYYGPVDSSLLFTPTEFNGYIGYGSIWNRVGLWDKFLYKGKILFIPRGPLVSGVTWNGLYSLGLVYGVDGPGLPKGSAPRNQLVTIPKGNFDFKIRCMRLTNSDDYAMSNTADGLDGEVRLLTGAVFLNGPNIASKVFAFNSVNPSEYQAGGGNTSMHGILAEASTSSCNITAGNPYVISSTTRNDPTSWRPVLELIQPPRG